MGAIARANIEMFIKKSEFRGLVTEEAWTDEMLGLALATYRKQAISESKDEQTIDNILKIFAQRLGIDPNRVRHSFYGLQIANPTIETEDGVDE